MSSAYGALTSKIEPGACRSRGRVRAGRVGGQTVPSKVSWMFLTEGRSTKSTRNHEACNNVTRLQQRICLKYNIVM